ncbi:MAG TPA: hypothetical protein VGP46_13750, partial [Acidimicrobiales bacterium]|nr:hypothetical protein [Acidimicrobiales bacterium]
MSATGVQIDQVTGDEELLDFVLFADEVNASRPAYWPAMPDLNLPFLKGEGPEAAGRKVLPLVARSGGRIVARTAAVVDHRYIDHWDEPLGHVIMFESLPDRTEAVQALMNEASAWLKAEGLEAVRTGFGPSFDMPYLLDSYDSLPPLSTRQNPAYYHHMLKEARFEAEKGWVDYKIEVTPERLDLWRHMVEAAEKAGFRIAPMADVAADRRVPDFHAAFTEAFDRHWGWSPHDETEWAELFEFTGLIGGFDVSILAYDDDDCVGAVLGIPDLSGLAVCADGREIRPDERLNLLGIGVRRAARGRGVNLAMAALCYLQLAKAGNTHVSYTMVLDDNWPSRR